MKLKLIEDFLKSKGINILISILLASMILSIGVSSITLVSLYIISIVFILIRIKSIIIKPIDIIFLMFFGIQALSFFWSENKSEYFNEIEKVLIFLFIPFLFVYIRSNNVVIKFNTIAISYIISLIIFGLILIGFSLSDIIINNKPIIEFISKNVRFNLIELSPISFHTPFFGMFLVFGIVLCIYLKNELSIPKSFIYSTILFFLFLLYLNSNLSSFISLLAIIGILLLFKLKKKTIIILFVTITTISITVLSLFYTEIQEALHYDPTDGYWETPRYRILRFLHEGDPTRKKTWESAMIIIKDNFWIGTGIGDLTDLLQTFRAKDSYAFINRLNSHNQYLSILGTTGVIGFFIFLLLMGNNLILAIRNKSLLFFSFLIIIAIAFFTDNILSRQWGLIFFCIFNYLIYEHYSTAKRENQ